MLKSRFNPKVILLFCIWVPLYMWWGTPDNPLNEALNLAAQHTNMLQRLLYILASLGIGFIAAAAMFMLAFTKSRKSLIVFLLLAFMHVLDIGFIRSANTRFTVSEYIYLRNEIGYTFTALQEFSAPFIVALLMTSIFVAVTLVLRHFFAFRSRRGLHWVCLFMGFSAVMLSLYASAPGKRDNYVSSIRLPAIVSYAHLFPKDSGLSIPYAKRILAPNIAPAHKPKAKHILLLIDESVTGPYLSINGYPLPTTPYLEKISDTYVNLGSIISVSNLSMNSNYILRSGLTPDLLPDAKHKSLSVPSIFTYAKRAGMYTALIDAQQAVPMLQNYLSKYDMEDIDTYQYFPVTDNRYNNDFIAMQKVLELQRQHESTMIVLVKYGAHFRYHDHYPPNKLYFKPEMIESTMSTGGSETQVRSNVRESAEGRICLVNSYLNAIRWNVDDFFEMFLPQILDDTLIIYTSDHGQSILDADVLSYHGAPAAPPPAAQVAVPLLLFGEGFKKLFTQQSQLHNYSQYQVFPSLLSLMGYDHSVTSKYGNTFWEGGGESMTFTGYIFSSAGRVSKVNLDSVKVALPDGNFASEPKQHK